MKTLPAIAAIGWAVLGGAPAQQPAGAPVELAWDAAGTAVEMSWQGEAGCSYFVEGSPDLLDWRYFNFLAQGDPAGHRFPFACPAARYFVRLRTTFEPTGASGDPDGDGLSTGFELAHSMATGLSPLEADSDKDGVPDGHADPDGDGLTNLLEQQLGLNPAAADSDGDGAADGHGDWDFDGIGDLAELAAGTDPANPDTDGDGMPDGWESGWGLDPLDGADAAGDPDEDRVSNLREFQVGTPPCGGYQVEELVIAGVGDPALLLAGGDGSLLVAGDDAGGSWGWFTAAPDPAAPGAFGVAPCGAGGEDLLEWCMEPFHVLPAAAGGGFCAWARHPGSGGWMCATVGPDVGFWPEPLQWLDQSAGSWLDCRPRSQGSVFGRHQLLEPAAEAVLGGRRLLLTTPTPPAAAPPIAVLPQTDPWDYPIDWCAVDEAGRAWGLVDDPGCGLLLVAGEPDPWSESGEWWTTDEHMLPEGLAIDPAAASWTSPAGDCLFHGTRRTEAGAWEDCLVSFEPASASFATHTLSADDPPLGINDRGEILTGRRLETARGTVPLGRLCVLPAGAAAGVRLADLGYSNLAAAGFDPEGNILATACKADAGTAILRLTPAADRNHDGVPDDWVTHWKQAILDLLGADIPPALLARLEAGELDAACADLYGPGTTLAQLYQTSGTAGDGTIREEDKDLYAVEFAVTTESQYVYSGTGFWPLDLPAGTPPGDTLYLTRESREDYSVAGSPTLADHTLAEGGRTVTTSWLDAGGHLLAEAAEEITGVTFAEWKDNPANQKPLAPGRTLRRGAEETTTDRVLTASRQVVTTTTTTPWRITEGAEEVASGTEVVVEQESVTLTGPHTPAQLRAACLPHQPWQAHDELRYGPTRWSDYDRGVLGEAAAAKAVRTNFLDGESRVEGVVSDSSAGGQVFSYCSNTRLAALKWRWLRFNPADPFHPIAQPPPAGHQQVETLKIDRHERLAPDWESPGNPYGPEQVDESSTTGVLAVTCDGGLAGWQPVDTSIFDPHARKDPANPDQYLDPTWVQYSSFRRPASTTVSFGPPDLLAQLVPDCNRDGIIDCEDDGKVTPDNPWRLWVNDDDDQGFEEGDDVPRGADDQDADCNNLRVDGVRDLVDFFALELQVSKLIWLLPPDKFDYWLVGPSTGGQPTFRVSECPDLLANRCDAYLKDVAAATNLASNESHGLRSSFPLTNQMITALKDGKGLILVEACRPTPENGVKLKLQVVRKSTLAIAAEFSLPVAATGVEQFFRHKNLRLDAAEIEPDKERDYPPPDGGKDRMNEPANFPDSCCNEDWLVLLHGYNVNAQQARGWHAEAFKRFFWSGNHARFLGVSWYGDESQIPSQNLTPKYYENVDNALNTAESLAMFINGLEGGKKYAAAHSLGCLLAADAIANHGAQLEHAFLFNPAVATESLLPKTAILNDLPCEPQTWRAYPEEIKASEWYRLFEAGDARGSLSWRGLVHAAVPRLTVMLSAGEETLAALPASEPPDPGWVGEQPYGSYAFVLQAMLKGMLGIEPSARHHSISAWVVSTATRSFQGLSPASKHGGWRWTGGIEDIDEFTGENWSYFDDLWLTRQTPDWFAGYLDSDAFVARLKRDPVFGVTVPPGCAGLFHPANGHQVARNPENFRRILAQMIPERTLPAGGAGGSGVDSGEKDEQGNLIYLVLPLKQKMVQAGGPSMVLQDMQQIQNGWPDQRTSPRWLHSDLREMAYLHVWPAFESVVSGKELNREPGT